MVFESYVLNLKWGEHMSTNEIDRREFFELLRESMKRNNLASNPQKPKTNAYTLDLVDFGISGAYLTNKIDSCGNYLEHMVFLKNTQCKPSPECFLNELYKYKDDIENELGIGKLNWTNRHGSKNKVISVTHQFNFRDREHWLEGVLWLTSMMIKFESVFRPYVCKVRDELQK